MTKKMTILTFTLATLGILCVSLASQYIGNTEYSTQITPDDIVNLETATTLEKWQYLDAKSDYYSLQENAEANNFRQATIHLPFIWPPDGHEEVNLIVRVSYITAIHSKPWTKDDGTVAYGTTIYMSNGQKWHVDMHPRNLSIELTKLGWGNTILFEPLDVQ